MRVMGYGIRYVLQTIQCIQVHREAFFQQEVLLQLVDYLPCCSSYSRLLGSHNINGICASRQTAKAVYFLL